MSPSFVSKMDLRGLEPPEPMRRVLEALSTTPAGAILEARLERRPLFLIEELNRRGQKHGCEPHPAGGWQLTIPIPAAEVTRSTNP
jgi:uncharacterized protein (DUF2249 family)